MDCDVFFVDDDSHMRRAVARLLTTHGYCARTFASATDFLADDIPSGPACLLLDLKMPDISGLELQRILAQADKYMPIIFVSGQADVSSSIRAMKAGAVDFLIKPFNEDQLISAIRIALDKSRNAHDERISLRRDQEAFDRLTLREREVCVLVARGLLNKQVGFELGTAEKTVKVQRARVMQKLHAESLADVVRLVERLRAAGKIAA